MNNFYTDKQKAFLAKAKDAEHRSVLAKLDISELSQVFNKKSRKNPRIAENYLAMSGVQNASKYIGDGLPFMLDNLIQTDFMANQNYLAQRLFPITFVTQHSGAFRKFDSSELLEGVRSPVAENSLPSEIPTPELTSDSYTINKWGNMILCADAMVDDFGGVGIDAIRWAYGTLASKLLVGYEKWFFDTFFQPGVWGTNWSGVTGTPGANQFQRWDVVGSTPVTDVKRLSREVRERFGRAPNVMTVDEHTHDKLTTNQEVLMSAMAYLGMEVYPTESMVTNSLLARIFGMDEYNVSNSVHKPAGEILAKPIARKGALFTFTDNENPDKFNMMSGMARATSGKSFVRLPTNAPILVPQDNQFMYTYTKYIEERETTMCIVRYGMDTKITAANSGAFLADTVS